MKFSPLITRTEVMRNEVEIVHRGSDNRYYISPVEHPDEWSSSVPTFAQAIQHLNFTREFWNEKLTMKDDPRVARVNGVHYTVGDETADPRAFRGHGGSRFLIQFHDGRRMASTNLWCQGKIPRALYPLLPNNAEFILLKSEESVTGPTHGKREVMPSPELMVMAALACGLPDLLWWIRR